MVVEWFGLKTLFLGFFFGYLVRSLVQSYNTVRCYEIKEFRLLNIGNKSSSLIEKRRNYEEQKTS
jgi:hypothetical protein